MLTCTQCATIVAGKLTGGDAEFHSVSKDTRTLESGALYVAITGDQFDGHHFVDQAKAAGAVAVLVDRTVSCELPQIQVNDTIAALGQLASYWRDQFDIPIAAITGSCGKTTTRELLTNIMATQGEALAPKANLNNDIGVPLTLLRLRAHHHAAVIEMGANHAGEIAYLTKLTRPTVALITNVAPVHLEGFGDLDGIAHAKAEIYQGLPQDGTAIFNADDAFADFWRSHTKAFKQLCFGQNPAADVFAQGIVLDAQGVASFNLVLPNARLPIRLKLLGRHNVMNALAAASAAYALGVAPEHIQTGLANAEPFSKRLVRYPGLNDTTIIDDTYNASPVAVNAAIQMLAATPGRRILVLGDMGELGEETVDYHRQIGDTAKHAGIDALYACGKLTQNTVKKFGAQGFYFPKQADLITALKIELKPNTTFLVKGSRSQKMEHVVEELLEEQ